MVLTSDAKETCSFNKWQNLHRCAKHILTSTAKAQDASHNVSHEAAHIHTHTHTHRRTLCHLPFAIEPRLTYSQLLAEDCPFSQRRTVPASVSELVLTLIDAHLGAFAHNDDGVRAALADGPLARCQPGNLVADDVSTQSHHRGQSPVKVRETHVRMYSYTQRHTHMHRCTHRQTHTHTHTYRLG